MANAAEAAGAPKGIINCMSIATVEGTEALMKHKRTAVILATGGTGLVRAAYSSGKPAFGVGPGNVPAFIEKTADVHKAVRDILTSKCFDNGTICASEQAIIADQSVDEQVRRELAAQGGYFLTADQAEKLGRLVMTPNKSLNPKIVGQYAEKIAAMAGISVDGAWCHIAYAREAKLKFPLLSDFEPKGAVARSYGAYREHDGTAERALFLIDGEGIIRWSYVSPVGVNPGADGVLQALEELTAKEKVA